MKPILVGAAPGKNGNPDYPLFPYPSHMAGAKLMELMGATRREYLTLFDRTNTIREFPGSSGTGDLFPMSVARENAARLERDLLPGRRVLFVGKTVAEAYGFKREFLAWHSHHGYEAACLPHTSGRNRWYNDDQNRQNARVFLASLLAFARELEASAQAEK